MFTGIVEDHRPVTAVRARADAGLDVVVNLGSLADGIALGDSIAVNGCCLTAARIDGPSITFELSPETLQKTTLGSAQAGQSVNVERALRLGDRLGGHWVQGHVDGRGTVKSLGRTGEWAELEIHIPEPLDRYCILKGSICIDGVSLTIARLDRAPGGAIIMIALVPHTLDRTTLGRARAGQAVNVECDVLAKYVENLLQPHRAGGGA